MRKGVRRLVALLVVLLLAFSLVGCTTKLSGTYVNEENLIKQSLTFKEGNLVDVSAFGINVEGEYEIKNDKIIITYKMNGALLNLSYDMEKDFEKKGNSIFIDGTEFIKE